MKRRLLSSLLVAMTLAVSVPAPVYAADTSSDSAVETEDSTEGEEKKPWYSEVWDWLTGDDEEGGEKLEKTSDKSKRVQTMSDIAAILKKAKMGNKKQIAVKAQVVADIIVTLRGFGLSDSAILGVLVNIMHESQFNPYIIQGQTTTEAMSAFDMNTGYLKINGKNYNDTVENVTARYAERDYTVDYTKQTALNMGIGLCQWTESRKLQLLAVGNHTRSDRKTCIWNLSGTNTNWAISEESLGDFRTWSQYQPDSNMGRNYSITHLTVPSAPLQMAFLVKGISKDGEGSAEQSATGGSGENSFLGGLESEDVAKWSVQGGIGDSGWMDNIEVYVEKHPDLAFQYGGAEEMTFEEFCSLDDPLKAAEAFAAHFERCGDEKRYKSIEKDCGLLAPLLDLSTDGLLEASASYSNTEDVAGIVTSMVSTGYLTEDELSSFSKGAELNVDAQLLRNAVRESLNQDDIYNLANWERNVEYDQTDSKLIVLGRRILIALGVIFEVWGMLIYLAYWFDRLNNFIPIDLLNILTLGKLRIADSDTEVTFSIRDNSTRSRVKTVNHRAVLFIAITAIAFGTLIVTGTLFRILFGVVAFVRKLLK